MTPDEARRVQQQVVDAQAHFKYSIKERERVFLQLSRAGITARDIAKMAGINYSMVYRILDRAGYTPKYSHVKGKLRNDTQKAIVEDLRKKMAAKRKTQVTSLPQESDPQPHNEHATAQTEPPN